MKREGKKVSEFPAATSFTGLWTLGVDSASRSVKVSLDFIKSGYDAVVVATSRAVTATTNAKTATSQAVTAKDAANTAATAANNAKTSAIAATVAANALVGGMNASLADKITPAELTAALATKAALIPQSFTEQPVPGEFWIGNDNVSRQVYVRTFAGNFATATGEVVLATGARECKVDNGGMYNPHIPNFTMPGWYSINASNAYQFNIALWEGTLSILYDTTSAQFPVSTFSVTIKYTKA